MNWFEAVDGYCERIDASVWSEPLNALTNIFFLVAAVWVLRREGPVSYTHLRAHETLR